MYGICAVWLSLRRCLGELCSFSFFAGMGALLGPFGFCRRGLVTLDLSSFAKALQSLKEALNESESETFISGLT
jgi:hypothetical protein